MFTIDKVIKIYFGSQIINNEKLNTSPNLILASLTNLINRIE